MPDTPKIAIVGAGAYVFPLRISLDVLSFPELQACHFSLMDIHKGRLTRTEGLLKHALAHHGLPAKVTATTDLRRALTGADFIIVAFQVGGVAAYRHDVEIPRRYGLDQCVGDTLGPGGVFRGLRSIPAYLEIARTMKAVCPDALLINYANPMSINCWALNTTGVKAVGLCHSVQGTSGMLVRHLGLPYDEVDWTCYGINHQAWFTSFRHNGKDVYPRLRRIMFRDYPSPDDGTRRRKTKATTYGETVRTEIMRTFGYFHTESSHHASEYMPWFRKTARMVKRYIPKRWDYYEITRGRQSKASFRRLREVAERPLEASHEYGAYIVHSMVTDTKRVIYGNVPNYGPPGARLEGSTAHLIPNLPRECCVELACLVDRNGIQPTAPGPLPPQLAAVTRTCVNVQELAVEGALTGDPDRVVQAISLDPLTGALLTLPQIRRMVADLLRAERRWLPQFKTGR